MSVRVKALDFDVEEFIASYNSAEYIRDAALELGIPYHTCRDRARILRRLGYRVKEMPPGLRHGDHRRRNRKVDGEWTEEALGIPEGELRELVEAFRRRDTMG